MRIYVTVSQNKSLVVGIFWFSDIWKYIYGKGYVRSAIMCAKVKCVQNEIEGDKKVFK